MLCFFLVCVISFIAPFFIKLDFFVFCAALYKWGGRARVGRCAPKNRGESVVRSGSGRRSGEASGGGRRGKYPFSLKDSSKPFAVPPPFNSNKTKKTQQRRKKGGTQAAPDQQGRPNNHRVQVICLCLFVIRKTGGGEQKENEEILVSLPSPLSLARAATADSPLSLFLSVSLSLSPSLLSRVVKNTVLIVCSLKKKGTAKAAAEGKK